MPEEKIYIGCKLKKAYRLDYNTFLRNHRNKTIKENQENQEGYLVKYPDGYISWSPKDEFERVNREVSENEIDFI